MKTSKACRPVVKVCLVVSPTWLSSRISPIDPKIRSRRPWRSFASFYLPCPKTASSTPKDTPKRHCTDSRRATERLGRADSLTGQRAKPMSVMMGPRLPRPAQTPQWPHPHSATTLAPALWPSLLPQAVSLSPRSRTCRPKQRRMPRLNQNSV